MKLSQGLPTLSSRGGERTSRTFREPVDGSTARPPGTVESRDATESLDRAVGAFRGTGTRHRPGTRDGPAAVVDAAGPCLPN
ncbi:hypothetical protein GCM10025792_53560 [Pseudonocardia tropica]